MNKMMTINTNPEEKMNDRVKWKKNQNVKEREGKGQRNRETEKK